MKRRRFFKSLAVVPAGTVLLAQQPATQPAPTPAAPPAGRGARGGRGGGAPAAPPAAVPDIGITAVGEQVQKFFTATQFATLKRLADHLHPAENGDPSAVECHAPEFLDFLLSVSPAPEQATYRVGLDLLNSKARTQFKKAFADLDAKQVDTIIKPLVVAVPWAWALPKDPGERILYVANRDLRTAHRNSREYAEAGIASGRRQPFPQAFLLPVDPTYKG